MGIVAAIALPAYQNHTVREKVTEVYYIGEEANKNVEIYMSKYGRAPIDLSEAGFISYSLLISRIYVSKKNGSVKLVLNFNPLTGKEITFVPFEIDSDVSWQCLGEGIKKSYLPVNCR
jgi:Tfp pilus assembly major pilin PilA